MCCSGKQREHIAFIWKQLGLFISGECWSRQLRGLFTWWPVQTLIGEISSRHQQICSFHAGVVAPPISLLQPVGLTSTAMRHERNEGKDCEWLCGSPSTTGDTTQSNSSSQERTSHAFSGEALQVCPKPVE